MSPRKTTSTTAVKPGANAVAKPFVHSKNVSVSPPVMADKRAPPLSWKEAVQRAPAQPQPKNPTSSLSDQSSSTDFCTPTKLAARSRSVSRIVQSASYRKRGDLFPASGSAEGHSTNMTHDEPSAAMGSVQATHAKKNGVVKQVSFKSDDAKCAVNEKKIRSDSDTQRFTDLVNRLGLNDTQLMLAHSRGKKKTATTGGRPRSASADTVLLRRESPPLFALTDSPVTAAELKNGKVNSAAFRRSRKNRAMSVPNAAPVSDICPEESKSGGAPHDERAKRLFDIAKTGVTSEEDTTSNSELDCDDTHSESTSDSSCSSPRHSNATHFVVQHDPVHLQALGSVDEQDDFSDFMTPEDEEEEEQHEAFMLLDRINSLSAEFKAHREYEESSALAWSVQHAARQGVISPQLQQSLLTNIRNGAWEESRDVLYHKCHLVPAVGSIAEPQSALPSDPSVEESFARCVDELSPTDSSEARHQKLRVLKLLSDLLTKWVKIIGYERGLSEEHVALTSGSVFLAGSYRLGLNDPLADIDAVCVAPWHVTHEDFFSSFCSLLAQTSGVTHLAPVPNAYVPLISLSFLDVSVDLLFARLPMTGVESSQEIDSDHILVNVDPTSMKSLNAPRVSSMLLCLVPKRRVFRIVLRAVRAWARRRGIYSSKLGYLGGVSWAILVAFVCQMYPEAEPSKLFVRFFQVFSEWQWPRPVMLNMVYDAGLGFEMWDPRQNLYDRSHIMPVVTPAYPHMNSAVQVSQSTFSVIYEEIWRARYLAEAADGLSRSISLAASPASLDASVLGHKGDVASGVSPALSVNTGASAMAPGLAGAANSGSAFEWDKLFQRSNFFIRYDSYLVVDFYAESSSSMHVWGKFVQSRLRKLVDSLQHLSSVSRVHAFPLYFANTSDGRTPGSCMFIGVEFQSRSRTNTEIHGQAKDDPEIKSNLERTIRFFMATDLQQLAEKKQDMTAEARLLTWGELPDFVFEHGRPAAVVERAEYHEDMERMTMMQSHGMNYRSPGGGQYGNGGGERFSSGKWRSPNGGARNGGGTRYFGPKSGQHNASKPRSGGAGTAKPYYMAQAG